MRSQAAVPAVPAAPRVSVLMPTFEQAAFIGRALDSLWAQSYVDWELIIVNDGSCDDTAAALAPWLADARVRYLRFDSNGGLGRAINAGLDAARGELLAYLPSDDVWYRAHLAQLVACLEREPGAVLAYSGVRHHYNRSADGIVPGECLQPVQCLHRRSALRWRERAELESDDLERLFWAELRTQGAFVPTGVVSCEWVDHPDQRHKRMREPLGGINPFRQHYRVAGPLRFHTSTGNLIDEERLYAQARGAPAPAARTGLKIVLAGELAYNADRVLALEALGHRLYGLWTPTPGWFNTVGPLPFGQVEELPRRAWFLQERAPLLSARAGAAGEVHTVVPGRPIGLHPPVVAELARHRIHLHFYGDFTQGLWREWIAKAQALAPEHLHLHRNVDPDGWVREFSQYDAGWLHVFRSQNGGDIRRADWDDLNIPARVATMAAAGLPMIQFDNGDAIVAAQALARRLGIGLFFDSIENLARQLHDRQAMASLRERVWQVRDQFCFDLHAPGLVDFFGRVIAHADRQGRMRAGASLRSPPRRTPRRLSH